MLQPMSDRLKAALVVAFVLQYASALFWERIFPVRIRTEADYAAAMDELDKLGTAFDDHLTTTRDEKRMKELADAISRHDEKALKPAQTE